MDEKIVWANQNKKQIARELIRRGGFVKSEQPAAIFMAGLPGAGKTEFTKELLKEIAKKPIRIDMDEIAELIEGYNPRKADLFRSSATVVMEKIYDVAIKQKIDFVLDGTFSHPKALENLERALHQGYTTKIYYIYQDPVFAWKFTQSREIVEHRAITKDSFIDSYFKLWTNLEALQKAYEDVTISVIVKNQNNEEGKRYENISNIFDCIPAKKDYSELVSVIL